MMKIGIGCLLLAWSGAAAAKTKSCDGVASTTTPSWCVKPPAGYQLDAANPALEPGTQVFRNAATNQAFTVGWYPQAGGVDGRLKQLRSDVPKEGGKDSKEEAVPGGRLFRYQTSFGSTILLVLAAAGPGPTTGTDRVVTCKVSLPEANAEFAKQAAACKTLKVLH
jgi:hypothetical protein